ncbi:MAG: hypothetical protein K2X27_04505 [Candidatus Obscuribacterales bacterium]|nr:hypothetical protein [Candidatus Obscuribacterales bacterium]
MSRKAPSVLLGDLLVRTGLVSRRDLADAIPISLKTGLPVGRILIGSGAVRESTMQAVLFAQSLVRDRLLDEELACQAIMQVDASNCSLDDALAALGWHSDAYELTNRLGQLFLESGIITEGQLNTGLEAFYTTGLPLARVLVLSGTITPQLAFAGLAVQKMLRDEQISREQSIALLKSAKESGCHIADCLALHGIAEPETVNVLRLGELLVLANAVNEIELLDCVERSINRHQLIGETMVQSGRLAQYMLDNALVLQKMTNEQALAPSEAAEVLRRIHATGMNLDEALHELRAPAEKRSQLLGLQVNKLTAAPAEAADLNGHMPAEKVAEMLGITVKAVAKRIKKGALNGHQKEGKWYVKFSEFLAPDESAASSPLSESNQQASEPTLEEGESFGALENNESASIYSDSPVELLLRLQDSGELKVELPLKMQTASADYLPEFFSPEACSQQEENPGFSAFYAIQGDLIDCLHKRPQAEESAPQERQLASDLRAKLNFAGKKIRKAKSTAARKASVSGNTNNAELTETMGQHLGLVEKLLERIEYLSYRAGYLEAQLAAQQNQKLSLRQR